MAHASDPRFLVLHGLRLKGFAEAEPVAATTGLDEASIVATLAELADEGLVLRRDGRISGWSLTPTGRTTHAALVTGELGEAGTRDDVDGAYRRFLEVNGEMLGVCTAWQVKDPGEGQTINDHADAEYDRSVVERLRSIDERVQPVTGDLGAAMERFAGYGGRLSTALGRVEAGEPEWFTRPVIDSYHTVWFELHEDLLCTLGIERSSEGTH